MGTILFVVDTLGTGGAEQSIVNMIPEMRKAGHRCVVVALYPPLTLRADLEKLGAEVVVLGDAGDSNTVLSQRLLATIRSTSADIVQAYNFRAAILVAATKALAPKPLRILSLQSLDLDRYPPRNVIKKITRYLRLELLNWGFDRKFAVSEAVFRSYENHRRSFVTDVILNSVTERAFQTQPLSEERRSAKRASLGVTAPDQFLLVNAGRLVREKGQIYLIQALKQVRDKGILAKVAFCGPGPLELELREEAKRLGIEDQVVFLGNQPHPELFEWIQAADIFVLPSVTEGLCLALAEAMALGAPVVATRVGGNPEIVTDGEDGALVESRNPDELAQAISKLLANPDLRLAYSAKGRASADRKFRPSKIAALWEQMYASGKARAESQETRA